VIFVAVGVCGVLLSAAALVAAGSHAAMSVAAGAGIALLNLWALRGILGVLIQAAASDGRGSALGFFLVPKVMALFGLVWLLLTRRVVSAGPLAVGYAALPLGVAIGALVCKKAPR
jgi:hypothetical protein